MADRLIYDIEFKGVDAGKKSLEEITKLQIAQQEAVKKTQAEIKAYEKSMSELQKEIAKSGEASESQIKLEADYNEKLVNSKLALSSQKDELKATNAVRNEVVTAIDKQNIAIKAAAGSNEQLRAELYLLTKAYDQLGETERENTEEGKAYQAEILGITEKLKENESAVGDNRRNVGNYQAAVEGALNKVNVFGVNLGQLTKDIAENVKAGRGLINSMVDQAQASIAQAQGTTAMAASQGVATTSSGLLTRALGLLKIGLVQTGIGAIVVAVGLLVAAFLSTQRGSDALTRVLEPLKAIFSSLLGVVQNLATNIVDAFKNPQAALKSLGDIIEKQVVKRIQAVKDLFKDLLSFNIKGFASNFLSAFTAFDEIKGGIETTKEFLKEAVDKGKQLAELAIQMEKAQNNLNFLRDEYEDKERSLNLIAKDTSLSFAERAAAAEEIVKITADYAKEEAKVKQLQIDQLKIQQSLNDTKRTGKGSTEELIKLEMELDDINDKAEEKRLEQLRVISGVKKEQAAAAKAVADKEKERLEQIAEINRSETEQIKFEYEQKLALLKLNRDDAKLSEAELMAKAALSKDYYDTIEKREKDLAKIKQDIIDKELAEEQRQFEENLLLRDEAFQEQEALIRSAYLTEFELAKAKGEDLAKLDEEFKKAQLQRTQDFLKNEIAIISAQLQEQSAAIGTIDPLPESQKQALQQRLLELQENLKTLGNEFDNATTDPETGERKTLRAALGLSEEQVQNIGASYGAVTKGIQDAISIANKAITDSTNERIANIDEALKQGVISEEDATAQKEKITRDAFEQQKKLNKTQATIAYFNGLINAITQAFQLGPIAGPIVGGINSAILTASFAKNIQGIEKAKFADGGEVIGVGGSRTDHIDAKLSNGEFVQNASAVKFYGVDFMKAVNSKTFPTFANGGLVNPAPINTIGQQVSNSLGTIIDGAVNRQIEVIQVESEFSKTQNKVRNVEAARTY